jgi:hypothetical protein
MRRSRLGKVTKRLSPADKGAQVCIAEGRHVIHGPHYILDLVLVRVARDSVGHRSKRERWPILSHS